MRSKVVLLVIAVCLLLTGCTIRPKIYVDGQPALDNVVYGENSNGIRFKGIFFRTFVVTEGDEELVTPEYLNPIKSLMLPANTRDLKADIVVINRYKHFYNVTTVLVKRWDNVSAEERLHVYSGHLSYKRFQFNLPTKLKGGEVEEFRVNFTDRKGNLIFTTFHLRYQINTVPTHLGKGK